MLEMLVRHLNKFVVRKSAINRIRETSSALQMVNREAEDIELLRSGLSARFPSLAPSINKMVDGYITFSLTGETSNDVYQAFRHLYVATKGQSNKAIVEHVSRIFPAATEPSPANSAYGRFSSPDVLSIADQVRREGFYHVPTLLPERLLLGIKKSLEASISKNDGFVQHKEAMGRISFEESGLVEIPELLEIAADPMLREVTSQVFGAPSVLGYVNSWISRAHNNDAQTLSAAAQLFHFDMSHPKFLKAFIYLSDVDDDNGPHCMIPQSHEQRDDSLWRDGRIDDEEIALHYDKNNWKFFKGKAGSTFIVDSSTFHKGLALKSGSRHILEIYYVNTLFGEDSPTPKIKRDVAKFGCPARFWSRYNLSIDRGLQS